MSVHRWSTRFLVLLCLFALQLQLFASWVMVCKHTKGSEVAIVCPLHADMSASQGAEKADFMLDCQKCVLGFFLGGCQHMASTLPSGFFSVSHVKVAEAPRHFYDFVPDRPNRPPISLKGWI